MHFAQSDYLFYPVTPTTRPQGAPVIAALVLYPCLLPMMEAVIAIPGGEFLAVIRPIQNVKRFISCGLLYANPR